MTSKNETKNPKTPEAPSMESMRAGLRSQLRTVPQLRATTPDMPEVDLSEHVDLFRDAGWTIISVVGNQPKGSEWDVRQPYSWTDQAMELFVGIIEPRLERILLEKKKVIVLARVDDWSLGHAAHLSVDRLSEAISKTDYDLQIVGVPVEMYATRPRHQTERFEVSRSRISNGQASPSGFLPTATALQRGYESGMDYRAVEANIAELGDFTFGCSRIVLHWQSELLKKCASEGVPPSSRFENLHASLQMVLNPGETASNVVSAGFVNPADLLAKTPTSASENRFEK